MRIKNVSELREFVAEQIERLCNNEIEPETANACAMLSENMLLSVRLELEYSRLKSEKPSINFMEQKLLIDHKTGNKNG